MDLISIFLAGMFVLVVGMIAERRKKHSESKERENYNDELMQAWMDYHLQVDSSIDETACFPDPVTSKTGEISAYLNGVDSLAVVLRYLEIANERKAKKSVILLIQQRKGVLYLALRKKLFGA